MALTMLDKKAAVEDRGEWPAEIKAEFERESRAPQRLRGHGACCRKPIKVRVWIIRLQPGERVGFHRHVLDYFWTSVNGGRGRQHLMDGTTVEHTYFPGETRHETYGSGQYKVHDLENLGDREMIFNDHRIPGQRQQAAAGARQRAAVPLVGRLRSDEAGVPRRFREDDRGAVHRPVGSPRSGEARTGIDDVHAVVAHEPSRLQARTEQCRAASLAARYRRAPRPGIETIAASAAALRRMQDTSQAAPHPAHCAAKTTRARCVLKNTAGKRPQPGEQVVSAANC